MQSIQILWNYDNAMIAGLSETMLNRLGWILPTEVLAKNGIRILLEAIVVQRPTHHCQRIFAVQQYEQGKYFIHLFW